MALSLKDCDRMLAAAKAAKRQLLIAQCVRFFPENVYVLLKTHPLADDPADVLAQATDGKVTIRLEASAKGLAVYGAKAGRYPLEPTVFFTGTGASVRPFDPNEILLKTRAGMGGRWTCGLAIENAGK